MRYTIIDFMPLVHKYINGAEPLTYTVNIDGVIKTIDTTIPYYTIKHILRCSEDGANATAVCLDGGSKYRKLYFAKGFAESEGIEYKGGRKALYSTTKEGADLAINCLVRGKVSCYRREGYEADDWIYTLVKQLKAEGVTEPIDIFTNDRDMLPLVDEQVSVYIASKRQYNESGSPMVKGYFQVTPRTMATYCDYSSEYREYGLTYNAILLYKIIKGDKSDNIPAAVKGYGKKTFNNLMQTLQNDGVEISKIFRYGVDFDTVIAPIMQHYFKEDEVAKMKYIYNGINLREVPLLPDKQRIPLMPIRKDVLQVVLSPFGIHIGRC